VLVRDGTIPGEKRQERQQEQGERPPIHRHPDRQSSQVAIHLQQLSRTADLTAAVGGRR
jgi:hypothetical protein